MVLSIVIVRSRLFNSPMSCCFHVHCKKVFSSVSLAGFGWNFFSIKKKRSKSARVRALAGPRRVL